MDFVAAIKNLKVKFLRTAGFNFLSELPTVSIRNRLIVATMRQEKAVFTERFSVVEGRALAVFFLSFRSRRSTTHRGDVRTVISIFLMPGRQISDRTPA